MPRPGVGHDPGGAGHSQVDGALGPVHVVHVIGHKHRPVIQHSEACELKTLAGEAQPHHQMPQLDEPKYEPVDILPMTHSIYR